ncbi:Spy/CpxP family protein refolding chaperone [Aminobacter sp. LjRoot7]|uniref:Spy/CpxP family protein refolding chaperone n=1 Tax=Aminobacter sp. LjRoot7 TaxID=3342335 RepID=UPI003ECC9901
MTKFFANAAVVIAIGAAFVSPSYAQPQQGMMGMMGGGCPTVGMMGHGRMGLGGWGDGSWFGGLMGRQPKMGAMVEGRLAYLKGELNITSDQQPAWDAYATAVTERVELMQGMHEGIAKTMGTGTAPERMDARISGMEAMLESMKAMKPATEGLYSVLKDEQKAVADELIGGDCGAF